MPNLYLRQMAGPAGNQMGLLNSQGQPPLGVQASVIDPSDISYPAPGGGLLRVPVGGGVATPLQGTLNGQLVQWDNTNGLWLPTPTAPADGNIATWDAAANTWKFTAAPNVGALNYFDTTFSPVGLWNFNSTLADSSGNGNDLVLAAGNGGFSDVVPGKKGLFVWIGARYATAAAVALLQIPGDITIETIIQQDGNPVANNQVLVTYRGTTSATQPDNILYQFRNDLTGAFTTTRNVASVSQSGAAVAATYSSAGTTASLGCIHNIVFLAMRRQANVVTFFLNGLPFANASGVLTTPDGGNGVNTRFCVGANGPSSTNLEVALLIFGVKVINRALTNAEIKSEYNRTMGPAFGVIA